MKNKNWFYYQKFTGKIWARRGKGKDLLVQKPSNLVIDDHEIQYRIMIAYFIYSDHGIRKEKNFLVQVPSKSVLDDRHEIIQDNS